MLALRYASLLALAVWLGGMLVLGGIAAPVAFAVLEASDPAIGRSLAGTVFGEMLRRFHLVTYACGITMILSLSTRTLLGPRPLRFWVRLAVIGTMLVLSLYSGLWLTSQIDRLQHDIGALASTLADDDPRRARFGFLHGLSTTLMGLNMAGALVLAYWEARE